MPQDYAEDIAVRPIRPDDGPAMWAMFRRMSPESRRYFWPHPFTRTEADKWAAAADDPEQVVRVAGDEAGRIYGYAWYNPVSDPVPLVGIGLSDDGQARGLGKRLLASLEEEARRTGHRALRLTVHKENPRAQRLYTSCGYRFTKDDPSHHDYHMHLPIDEPEPAFADRGMYVHSIPWHLTGLTPDTWTLEQWSWYLRLLKAAGCNLLKVYIWPTQMFHPNDPATAHNAWRYEVYREALGLARLWGMKTFIGFANTAVPPHVWHARPDLRAEEHLYRGVNLCWRRGKKTLLRYHRHLLDTFADVVDGALVWFFDPGSCTCSLCEDYVGVVRDSVDTYRELLVGRADVHVSLWMFDRIETGDDGGRVIPGFRRKVIEAMPRGTVLLVPDDIEPDLLDAARDRDLTPLTMAFYQDPESGLESHSILPRPRLAETERFIRGQMERSTRSLLGYRLTPFTQFPADWVMLRKMWEPGAHASALLRELGAYVFGKPEDPSDAPERFAGAIEKIERWWQGGGEYTTRRDTLLADAIESFDELTWRYDYPMRALTDATRVLGKLSRFRSSGGSDVNALASRVQEMMTAMPIFQGFVQDQLWERTRARHFVRDRLRWWLETLLPV